MKYFILKLQLVPCMLVLLPATGCENIDWLMATSAGIDAAKVMTLSEKDVQKISVAASKQLDAQFQLAPPAHPYAKRLTAVLARYSAASDIPFNYKVYLTREVNAFAMADGSIRIFSGLMDMLDDDELLFVIGHEMGHVSLKHIHDKLRIAYAANATRKAAASIEGAISDIARSEIGSFMQQVTAAQFSQHEEREADDYGLAFMQENSVNPQAAVTSLHKLAGLGSKHSFLSSHPAPEARAKRITAQLAGKPADKTPQDQGWGAAIQQLIAGLIAILKKILSFFMSLF